MASNERWCRDLFEIAAWNGEVVHVAFALDCHDREALALEGWLHEPSSREMQRVLATAVDHRFGTRRAPMPIEWLTDNGSVYTALPTVLRAEQLGLVPITTPPASPESNGMSEAFVNTLRRDYFDEADLSTGLAILRQLPTILADYNTEAPHSALGMRAPVEYRRAVPFGTFSYAACLANWGSEQRAWAAWVPRRARKDHWKRVMGVGRGAEMAGPPRF